MFEPFCGSATTGVVALRHNRRFVGIDLEQEYFDKFAIPGLKNELVRRELLLFQTFPMVAR